jgi:hypothetical protein
MSAMSSTSIKTIGWATVSLLAFMPVTFAQDGAGFVIRRGDTVLAGDAAVPRKAKPAAQSRLANVHVTADGLGSRPRLDLEVVAAPRGQAVVRSRLNYPRWVSRGELRVIDPDTGRLLKTIAMPSNGQVTVDLPQEDVAAVYRVYDAAGRYDETVPVSLARVHVSLEEEGIDRAARRSIPVRGGAVTVYGTGLAPGATVQTLGETLRADASGAFALQRILPPGDHAIAVQIAGQSSVYPVISIQKSEWFTVGIADLTFGKALSGADKGKSYQTGRLAYYTNGKTASGWEITSSGDTGEEELSDLFRNFDRKDPQGVLSRLDPDFAYPTYGDDSKLENNAPTDGKFYLKAEKDGSHILWGNFKGELVGGQYLRNERTLYGLQGVYRSPAQTANGEDRVAATLYAAQPDKLPGREVFLGTGGSVYFLQRQDIGQASETLTIELRDPVTGRVIEQRRLVVGRDYSINYIQGVITLVAPLSGTGTTATITPEASSAPEARLVAQYEYRPVAGEVDGYAFGGRVETWVTDQLRLGVTGMVEKTDAADQTATGADLRYTFGKNSFAEAEYARTEGPGFGNSYSADGGLIVNTLGSAAGTGDAYKFKTSLDLQDLGLNAEGSLGAYAEARMAGFSTLDHQTTADEDLWGISAEVKASERLSYKLAFDSFSSADGRSLDKGAVDVTLKQNERVTWTIGLAHEDRVEPANAVKTGARTDLGLSVSFKSSEALTWKLFGQTTLDRSGGRVQNDRIGAGVSLAFAKGWTFEGEVSDGSLGVGAKALVNYENAGSTAYFGYELDPGRELGGVTLNGRDAGRIVAGGKRRLSETTEIFGENTYDMFGRHRSLVSTYGVQYSPTKFLTLTGGIGVGRVNGATEDIDRNTLSFGLQYQNESGLSAKSRLEMRRDRGTSAGAPLHTDAVLLSGNVTYQVDDARRWLLSFDVADTDTTGSSVLSGTYAKATLGYAFRPVNNDRLNVLARYTYLYDLYGQRLDGVDTPGPRQKSHVFSIDATYDLSDRWEVGGKVGLRLSESAPDAATPLAQNDASLLVVNARYNLTYQWDVLLEARHLRATQAGLSDTGGLVTVSRQIGENFNLGLGYNFDAASDDLTDLTRERSGVFVNLVAKF